MASRHGNFFAKLVLAHERQRFAVIAMGLRETKFTPSTMSESSNADSHFEINRSFAHLDDSIIHYPAEEDSLAQQSGSFDNHEHEEQPVLSPSNRSTCTTPQKHNHKKMRQSIIDRRANDEDLYEGEPFFTSITESVSCSSEEAATQGVWSATRDTGKRGGGLFSRHRRINNNCNQNNPACNYDDEEFLYSATDEERDNIWATDGRDESVEVVTPFSLPNTDMKNMKSIPHHKSLDSSSSRTTSTWMQGTVGSGSLLDGEDDDSVSTTSLGSSPCSSNGETNRSLLDDEEEEDATYNTYETLQEGDEEFMGFSQPVESFLDDLAENKSIRKIGNFFLSRTCMTEQPLHEEEDDAADDDDENTFNTLEFEDYDEVYGDDDDEEEEEEERTSVRGRSRPPRNKDHPGIKLLFSLASSADSILETAAEAPLWQRMFSCTGETDFETLEEDEV